MEKELLKTLSSAIMAGLFISIGAIAYLSLENKFAGAFLFSIGLFVVCTFGLDLFTGKVCYVLKNGVRYAMRLPVIWLGNLLGTGMTALFIRNTRYAALSEKAKILASAKMEDGALSLFILGILCNMLIYIAVEGYKTCKYEIGKYLSIIFGVMAFIVCGFEHCVADMFYVCLAGAELQKGLPVILTVTAGNVVGGIGIAAARGYLKEE